MYEEFKKDIIKSIRRLTKSINGRLDDVTMEQLEKITNQSALLFGHFRYIFKPNKYMAAVLNHLIIFGAASINQIALFMDKKPDESIHTQIRKQARILLVLKIVDVEVLTYTYPAPTKIYVSSFCTIQQKQDAIDFYEPYRLRYEASQKPKEVVYTHTKAPIKQIKSGNSVISKGGIK